MNIELLSYFNHTLVWSNTLQIFLNDLSFDPYGHLVALVVSNSMQLYAL